MSWNRNLRQLQARSWAERWLLLEAAFWLTLVWPALKLLPFQRVAALLGLAAGENPLAIEASFSGESTPVGWAVRAVAARTPWASTCLMQAVAGAAMLRRRQTPTTLFLGVTKDTGQPEALAAHAWLRCGSAILTGASEQPHFTVVAAFHRNPAPMDQSYEQSQ